MTIWHQCENWKETKSRVRKNNWSHGLNLGKNRKTQLGSEDGNGKEMDSRDMKVQLMDCGD